MNLILRRMEYKDINDVCRLEKESFSEPWKEADFRNALENVNVCYLVAELSEQIVASCGVRNILGEGEITNVVTDKDKRNTGIGYCLLLNLLEEGEKMGISAFTLEVRKSNEAAIHLYEKLGFVVEGVRKDFYRKPMEDALIMWRRN